MMEQDTDTLTVLTRPDGIPVTIMADALAALPIAVWARGRSGTMKALSRDMPQPGGLLLVREHSSAVLLKQVIGTPEEQYDDVTKTVGSFANVRDPSLNAIRKNLPQDAWHISGETPAKTTPQPQPPGTLHPKPISKVVNMPKQARFYIDAPTGQVDLLEQTLLSIGIPFCPFDNMVHLPRENLLDSIFTGKEGQYAIDKVNEKLEELDLPERINLEFHQMTTETRWDLLAFVTMEIDWESEYQPEIQSLDPDRVTQFLSEHPETAVPQELK